MFYDNPQPIKHLSVSKIELILQCPEKFKLRYVDQIPEPSVGILTAGSVVHEVIEHALRQKVATGQYPDWKTMDDRYLPTWDKLIAKEEKKPSYIGWEWKDGDPEEKVKRECRELVRVASEKALPKIVPWVHDDEAVIEYRVNTKLRSKVGPFDLLGFIDLLESGGTLIDWKTTEKVSDRAKNSWLQFAAYSIFVHAVTGNESVEAKKIFLVRGKDPHMEEVPFTLTGKHRDYFVDLAAKVWEMIHYGVYIKNSESWACKPGWCGFYAGCRGDVAKKGE